MVWAYIIVLLLTGSLGAKRKISDVYLLLPQTLHVPNARHVKYAIQAYEGCYRWTTGNSKVVALTELSIDSFNFDPECQNPLLVRDFQGLECYPGAMLEPVAVVEHPPVTLISAIDQTNKAEALKCEVKVSKIKRLEILTTVKSFRVLDNQRLYAQAFDDEGNVFSSLEGLRFRWQIVTGSDSLCLPKLKDSLATLSEIRKEIENSNFQSDVILVEGKATGVANVTLKIEEPGYENVGLAWTLIYISEPFSLLPSPEVYLSVCSNFQFKLFKILERKIHKQVNLPSADYTWAVSSDYISVDNSGRVETQGKEGKWNVIVQDSKIDSNVVQCEINVIKPDRIVVSIEKYDKNYIQKTEYTSEEFQVLVNPPEKPKSNWYLISGEKYIMKIVLYWRNKEITISPNAYFSISFSESRLWDVVSRSSNGAEMIVIPKLPMDFSNNVYPTKLSGKLEYFESRHNCRLDVAITDTEEASIIRPIRIIEERVPVLLPYFAVMTQSPDKKGHSAQEYRLKVTGGSFSLKWESSDSSVVSVSPTGIVYAHRLGTCTVTVTDFNNQDNYDSIEIEVALVEKLIWAYERIEIVQATSQTAEIKGLASRDRVFHNCSSIYLDWELRKGQDMLKVKSKSFIDDAQRRSGTCEIRNIEGINEGQVYISTHLINSPSEITPKQPEIRLSSEEGRIGVFLPLSISLAESYEIIGNNKTYTQIEQKNAVVITPGSNIMLELTGGPLAWDDYISSHKEDLKDSERSSVIRNKILKDKKYLQLKCPAGTKNRDFEISLTVYNEKFDKLKLPGISTLNVILGCYVPFTMKLNWVLDPPLLYPASWRSLPSFYDRYKRRLTSEFSEAYWVILHSQELMVNITLWDSKSRLFTNFSSTNLEWLSDKQELISYLKSDTPPDRRLVRVGLNQGPVILEARIDRLKDGTILTPAVSSFLYNEVVKNVEVSPIEYSIYLHKQNVLEIQILYGSGYFDVSSNSTDILQFTYDGYRKISVFPKRAGKVGIRVDDTGLPGSYPAYCSILVSTLAGMELREGGLMPVNSTITLNLIALDSEGKGFNTVELKWMSVELSLGNAFQLVSVSPGYEEWVLKGFKVGEFQVYGFGFKTKLREDDSSTVRSNVIIIDVFPPLEIIPPDVLLLPGSKYTLNYRGGPDPSKYNFYSIYTAWVMTDEKIAVIDSNSGLVTALKIGDTPITIQMIRKRALLTKAEGKIRVRLATGVGILGMGPGRTVIKDSATRLIALLYHNGEEFTDSSMSIAYTWKSNSPTVYSIYQENEDTGKQVAVTGLALSGGKSDITLHVDVHYPVEYKDYDHLFNSKATASVDPGLYSQTPSHRCHSYITFNCHDEFPRWLDSTLLILPPHSSFKISMSKEEKTVYRCLECREDFLKLSDSGVLTSGSQRGESSIIIQHVRIKGDYHILPVVISDIEGIHIDKSYMGRNIALGSEIEFDITYQDYMARSMPRLFEYGIDVSIEVSNSRVIQASLENRNSTLRIYSQYVGDTIVKVYLTKNPSVKDMIKISVSSVMKPVSPISLHLGGEVQFETTHSTPAGVTGTWASENSNIVSVNDNGLAKSFQEGDTYIHYREKSMDLKSLVVVNKVKAIELGHEAPIQITNYEKLSSYRDRYKIPIKLYADLERNKEFVKLSEDLKKNIRQNIHVKCVTYTHNDFVVVESEIEKAEKERWGEDPGYGCIVTPITSPTTTSLAPKELIITVIVSSKGKSLYTFEGSVGIPFVPKFTIPGQDKHIVITGKSITHAVLISGACGTLQINTDTSVISSRKVETSGKCMVEFTILSTENELKLKRIEIIDSITGQKEELLISYYSDASKAEMSNPLGINDLIILISMILLGYAVYTYFKSNNPPTQNPRYQGGYPPRFPPNPPPRNQTPGPVPLGSTPGSSNIKNIAYRPNF